MPRLKMRDFLTISKQDRKTSLVVKDSSGAGSSLLVRAAASHAGVVNGNRRFYRPDRMQESISTWTPKNGYPRPVLLHHDEESEVLGRVVEARYVDESFKYATDYPAVKDTIFYRKDSKRVDLYHSIDWIVDNLQKMEGYAGLGYCEVGMNITNPDAIDKVLRGEYLTVSVGFSTDSAICSACHTDWADDDRCEHSPGEKVDGKPMFLIAGNIAYDEISFVNFPADFAAGVLSTEKMSDAATRMYFLGLSERAQKACVGTDFQMSDSLYEADIRRVPDTPEEKTVNKDNELDQLESTTAEETAELAAEAELLGKSGDSNTAASTEQEACTCETLEEGCDFCFYGDAPVDSLPEEDRELFASEDALYSEIEAEITAAIAAGELPEGYGDAKLTSGQRKKMKASTFCGPNRSFPVPDCAHVTAARRLLGRAKASESTKSKISACVSRKAKALGCSSSKDQAIFESHLIPLEDGSYKIPYGVHKAAEDALANRTQGVGSLVGLMTAKALAKKDSVSAETVQKIARYHSLHSEDSRDSDESKLVFGMWGGELAKVWSAQISDRLREEGTTIDLGDSYVPDQDASLTGLCKEVVDALINEPIDFSDKNAETLNKVIGDLDSLYHSVEDEKKYAVTSAVYAVLNRWDAESTLKWAQRELGDKLQEQVRNADALTAKAMKALKTQMATSIVMYKALTGKPGFTGLSLDKIQEAIQTLASRKLPSLQDAVNDVLTELQWVASQDTSASQTDESAREVEDSARIDDTETPTGKENQGTASNELSEADVEKALLSLPYQDRAKARARYKYTGRF